MDEEKRRRNLATDARARLVFATMALVIPLVLGLLFRRQELRLRALADHGRPGTATITAVTRQGSASNTHYRYDVDGVTHTWNVDRKKLQGEPGETFDITYLPEDPSLSRPGTYSQVELDGELNLPFRRGFPIGLFVAFGSAAAFCHRNVRRLQQGAPLATKPRISPEGAGRILAALFLGCVLAVNLDPNVRAVQVAAFGPAPLGLPVGLVVALAEVLLFAPFFWVFPHLMRLVMDRFAQGGSLSKLGIVLAVAQAGPEGRRSRRIVVAGLVYFIALVAGWIVFAASRGI
ncbi:hypothetical protein [Polyangium sorediatum]|uniref:DUF3592 domain-containing protein n=1 Tax=Polyangium sorediatum TaxID=889274 RepID=A0ABT6PA52_9BACT|nr:hypothetical protein [Polyangium sorediatum]MDI1437503.1 hypothetical protein [Polyangium sorediatum]